jgi:GAF domain-containing protein
MPPDQGRQAHAPAERRWLTHELELLLRDDDRSAGESLAGALQRAVEGVPWTLGAAGAALLLLDPGEVLRRVAATGPPGLALAGAQERLRAGPAHDALERYLPVGSADVTADERWPDLRHLLDPQAVRAVLAAPVGFPGAGPIGALCVHAVTPRDWTVAEIAGVSAYAETLGLLVAFGMQARLRGILLDHLVDALRGPVRRQQPEASP